MALATPTQLATRSVNTSGQTSWATGSITFPAGSLGIQLFDNAGGSNFATGVSDSVSGAWSTLNFASRASLNWTSMAYQQFASSTTCVLTTAFASSNETFGWAGYTSGHDTSAPKDADGNANTFSNSLAVTTSASLTANDEIVFVIYGGSLAAGPSVWPTTGYTSLFNPSDATRGFQASMEYQILTGGSGATQSTTATFAANRNMSAGIVTFKPAAGGGGAPVARMLGSLGVG